jgi:2'-5' RNA ligase
MKTFLELKVPIKFENQWFLELRSELKDANVIWQKDFYHITMVFVDRAPSNSGVCELLQKHLDSFETPTITFDKVDIFEAYTNGMQIVHLASTNPPKDFLQLVDDIRLDMSCLGGDIKSEFRLHVTLGRIMEPKLFIEETGSILDEFNLAPITLQLSDIDYREFRGRTIYTKKLNIPCEK